jgi:biotin transport system ATP-binding protein
LNLKTENLGFYFEKEKALLRNINLSFSGGEFVVLAGENGSGKSLLMKQLNGLFSPSSGRVLYNGTDVHKVKTEVRQKIGLIFQNSDTQFVAQTVFDEIAFGPENLGWKRDLIEDEVIRYADLLGVSSLLERHPHFLSGGEKKRVAIAGVLIMKPELIIFDEPFTTLDYNGVVSVCNEIVNCYNSGCTVLVITHDLEKVLAHATRLIIMKQGAVSYDGKPVLDSDLLSSNNIRVPYGKDRKTGSCTWLK